MFSRIAILTAGAAALASAYTTPKGDTPEGNAVYTPGLHEVVPAGSAYNITWDPTTTGKISVLLCKGPSTNCVITATLADSIANNGYYVWTPSTDLEPSQPTGYGLELVVEGTGQYQYSDQFGISNAEYKGSSSSSSSSGSSASATSTSTIASSGSGSSAAAAATTSSAVSAASSGSTTAVVDMVTSSAGSSTLHTSTKTGSGASSASTSAGNSTSAASGNSTASTSASTATQTGGAAQYGASLASLMFMAGIAVLAL